MTFVPTAASVHRCQRSLARERCLRVRLRLEGLRSWDSNSVELSKKRRIGIDQGTTKKDTKKVDKAVKTPESRRSEADDHYVDLDSVDESPSDSSGEMGAELFRAWADANFQKGNLSPSTGQSQQHWLFGDQAGSSESGSLESSEDKKGEKASSSGR
ncbi:unnamed protein product, partial [Cladocopium goreaui]